MMRDTKNILILGRAFNFNSKSHRQCSWNNLQNGNNKCKIIVNMIRKNKINKITRLNNMQVATLHIHFVNYFNCTDDDFSN